MNDIEAERKNKQVNITKYVQFLEVSETNDSTMFWPFQVPPPPRGRQRENVKAKKRIQDKKQVAWQTHKTKNKTNKK